MTYHQLKCHPEPFAAAWAGLKPYEIRDVSDRHFEVGDTLLLIEVIPGAGGVDGVTPVTGRVLEVEVTCITGPGRWGLPLNLCVMGTRVLRRSGDSRQLAGGFFARAEAWLVKTFAREL